MVAYIICALVLVSTIDVAQSEYDYLTSAQFWVKPHKIIATWYEAKAQCEKEGAVLASPLDSQLLYYMQSRIGVNKHSTSNFIGIKAIYEPELQFVSIEGVRVDDLPEAVTDFIEQLDLREGDCLAMDGESINVVSCWKRLPYICYKNDTKAPLEPVTKVVTTPVVATTEQAKMVTRPAYDPDPTKCTGSGYRYYPSVGCYKINEYVFMWDDANRICINEDAHLLILDDEKEAKEIIRIFGHLIDSLFVWTGIRDEVGDGTWRTVKGESIENKFKLWADYSRTMTGDPACGSLNIGSKLVKYECFNGLNVICEKDLY